MSGVFTDLLYPSNNDRGNRAVQLGFDISSMIYQLHQDKAAIDSKLATANKTLAAAYGVNPSSGVATKAVDIADSTVGTWTVYIADLFVPIFTGKAVSTALTNMFTTSLVAEGRLGEAAFASIVGLPGWMKWGSRLGGVASAAAVFVVVDVVISSITGAVQRDKLRDMIHEQIAPRLQLQQDVMKSEKILDTLTAAILGFDAVKDNITDPKMLDTIANSLVAKHHLDLATITPAAAQMVLDGLDVARGAWTDEDVAP